MISNHTNGHAEVPQSSSHVAEAAIAGAKKGWGTFVDAGRGAVRVVNEQIAARPYATIAIASGVAFGLGTLMGSRVGRLLTTLGAGYAVKHLVTGEVGARLGKLALDGLEHLVTRGKPAAAAS